MSSDASAPPVEYVRLGKSGLRISVPIVGAMSFGSDKWAVSVSKNGPSKRF